MADFFTADTHFGHRNIIRLCNRPFKDEDEMDRVLIENWNKVVGPKDTVWHLGDFAFRSKYPASHYLDQLNGNIHIIWGNHDEQAYLCKELFKSYADVAYIQLNKVKITLYHYAQRTWRSSFHGAWHLYGHSHGGLPPFGRSMDVGVDCHNFRPISFHEIKEYMDKQGATL